MNTPNIEATYSGATMAAEELCEDLDIPCERRQELLHELGKALGVDKVPAPFWACLQVCDLGQLGAIVDNARHAPWFVSSFVKQCSHQIPLLWLQVPQESDNDSASTWTDDISYEQHFEELYSTEAAERDGGVCVIKKTAPIVVAHIYPDFNQKVHAVKFWDKLSMF